VSRAGIEGDGSGVRRDVSVGRGKRASVARNVGLMSPMSLDGYPC
jgi:hypothetical protein